MRIWWTGRRANIREMRNMYIVVRKPNGRDDLGDWCKWERNVETDFKEKEVRAWSRFGWLRIWSSGGLLGQGNKPSCSIKEADNFFSDYWLPWGSQDFCLLKGMFLFSFINPPFTDNISRSCICQSVVFVHRNLNSHDYLLCDCALECYWIKPPQKRIKAVASYHCEKNYSNHAQTSNFSLSHTQKILRNQEMPSI
jgi:hypothetical protein